MVPALVELALDYYRNPVAYSHVADTSHALPRGFSELLADFGTALSSAHIEDTAKLLSTDVHELEEAARFFARHALLAPVGDYYRYLGLSSDAEPESIRRNYLMLIRMFHPDRVKDATDADLAYSSRLNAAYHVLHDPEERARYDQGLPRSFRRRSRSDPRRFFQPQLAVVATLEQRKLHRLRSVLTPRRRMSAAAGIAVLLGVLLAAGLLITREQAQPMLRLIEQNLGAEDPPMPGYLSGTTEISNASMPLATAGKADKHEQPAPTARPQPTITDKASKIVAPPIAQAVASAPSTPDLALEERKLLSPEPWPPPDQRSVQSDQRPSPPARQVPAARGAEKTVRKQDTGPRTAAGNAESPPTSPSQAIPIDKRTTPPVPVAAGVRLITRLEQAYRQGNADAIATLFTKSARTSDGSGRRLIRSQYARLFRDVSDQRLVVTNMSWRTTASAHLKGSGRFSVSTKAGASSEWLRSAGRIDIELVRVGTDVRISSMFYRLD